MLSKAEFEALTPRLRGYAVYMAGCREDQPHVPDEHCPYPDGSDDAKEWNRGQNVAVLEAQDGDD